MKNLTKEKGFRIYKTVDDLVYWHWMQSLTAQQELLKSCCRRRK